MKTFLVDRKKLDRVGILSALKEVRGVSQLEENLERNMGIVIIADDLKNLLNEIGRVRRICELPVMVIDEIDMHDYYSEILDRGADFCVPMSTGFGELNARLKSLGRRSANLNATQKDFLLFGEFKVSKESNELYTSTGGKIELNQSEHDFLLAFVRAGNHTVKRDELEKILTRNKQDGVDVPKVSTVIASLRDKIYGHACIEAKSDCYMILKGAGISLS